MLNSSWKSVLRTASKSLSHFNKNKLLSTRRAPRLTVGIRREDPTRTWERRCPVSPNAVAELVQMGVDVQVQHCERRIWTHEDFSKAGASIVSDVSNADIVLGIKEVPISELSSFPPGEQTHFMFSHTHKGQSHNMDLLSRFVHQGRLIDYELLADRAGRDGRRTIAFGWYAGAAGVVEGLVAYGRYLLTLGIATPMLHLPRPYMHPSLGEMKDSLRTLGRRVHEHGLPREAGPLIVAITGSGQVASGASDMLSEVPAVFVQPSELLKLVQDGGADLHSVYAVHVPPKVYLERKDGGQYDRNDYYSNPAEYHSVLPTLIAPFTSIIVNGAGWQPGYPRLMDSAQLADALQVAHALGPGRLGTIADVTCDLEGGLDFVTEATTIDDPFVVVKPPGSPAEHPGVHVMSIDILPTELPKDSSEHFSDALMPYLRAFVRSRLGYTLRSDDVPLLQAIDRATITRHGKLLPAHEWLYPQLEEITKPHASLPTSLAKKQTVLLLGSGMVAKPVVDTLCGRSDLSLIVASNDAREAAAVIKNHSNAQYVRVDASDARQLEALVAKVDVVISLLPAPMHPAIAQLCVRQRVHLVTASYISPSMKSLHDTALSADVLLLNECGLDPGIDHCAAVELIKRVQDSGKQVRSFISFCGGVPAPEYSNVPLGYKFSWAPKGVLTAAKNPATFKLDDEVIHVPGEQLLESFFSEVPLFQGFAFEGLANRNSFDYVDSYGLNPLENLSSHLRGTLRYKGFATLMSTLNQLGLLDDTQRLSPASWSSLTDLCLERIVGLPIKDPLSRGAAMTDVLGDKWYQAEASLEWLGLLPSTPTLGQDPLPPLPAVPLSPIDLLSILLSHRLRYLPGERDLVVLGHEVVAQPQLRDGSEMDATVHSSLLVVYGDERSSAMARTVGLPIAFAARRVLDGKVDVRGVVGPTHPAIYPSMLKDLASAGVVFRESVSPAPGIGHTLRSGWTGT